MKKSAGFTLIELVVVMTIMGVISMVIGRVMMHSYQTFSTSRNISEIDWNGFLGLERLVNDIHRIRLPADITSAQTNSLTFTDITGTSVSYTLSAGRVLRNSQILSQGVQTLVFSYLDSNGNVTSTPALIRYISISLGLTQTTLTSTFSTTAALRALS